MPQLIGLDDIAAAASRIGGHVLRTPTIQSPGLRSYLGVPVELKLELLQFTGSFKPRGAFNKMLGMSNRERSVGVVAVSGGNHGVAVAEVAGLLGITAVVVKPDYAPPASIARARVAGATVRLAPGMSEAFLCSTIWSWPGKARSGSSSSMMQRISRMFWSVSAVAG